MISQQHHALTQCQIDVGAVSSTLAQHQFNIGSLRGVARKSFTSQILTNPECSKYCVN